MSGLGDELPSPIRRGDPKWVVAPTRQAEIDSWPRPPSYHYFGSKQGLLEAIVEQFSVGVFVVPMRLLDHEPKSGDDFVSRIEMLFESTLDAYIEHRSVFMVVMREQADPQALPIFTERLVSFLELAKSKGFVRGELASEMLAGFFLDRILNQVQLAPWINRNYGTDIVGDETCKRQWCRDNLDVLLNGIVP